MKKYILIFLMFITIFYTSVAYAAIRSAVPLIIEYKGEYYALACNNPRYINQDGYLITRKDYWSDGIKILRGPLKDKVLDLAQQSSDCYKYAKIKNADRLPSLALQYYEKQFVLHEEDEGIYANPSEVNVSGSIQLLSVENNQESPTTTVIKYKVDDAVFYQIGGLLILMFVFYYLLRIAS